MVMSVKAALYVCLLLTGHAALRFASCAPHSIDDDSFTIRHMESGRCLESKDQQLSMGDCTGSPVQQWKWGTSHRLFHMASGRCMGIQAPTKTLALLSCDSTRDVLWWRCARRVIRTVSQLSLSAKNGTVSVWPDSQDNWTRDSSSDSICQQPHQVMYTTMGNSFGAPCEFPFRYNGSWHHGCLTGGQEKDLSWCATTLDYDADHKWGYCLKSEPSCSSLWKNPGWGSCYQYNLQSALPWHEARASCRSQGGDLLSFSSPKEHAFIAAEAGFPNQLWIGLNQLDSAQGWQWSDGSPLSFVKWNEGIPFTSVLREADCATMNSQGLWESEACGLRLPYICKKQLNQSDPLSDDTWLEKSTYCEYGWKPWNGFCYQLVKEPQKPMVEAQQHCQASGAALISMHSLVDVEAISIEIHNTTDRELQVWTGLRSEDNLTCFHWTDNSSVAFTYWARDEPRTLSDSKPNCVSYFGKSHLWMVSPCEKALPFVCKKRGDVKEIVNKGGCPQDGDWRRHGSTCYKVETEEVLFENRCDLTIMNRFEQMFINSLIKDHIATKTYFWTGLQDINGTGEFQWIARNGQSKDVPYTNWNKFEPELLGGCVVMSTAQPLGKWEVKDCKLFKAGSICKRTIGPQVEPDVEPDLNLPCPPGWMSSPDIHYCYKVFHKERLSRKRTWGEAERFCEALGAHLVSLSHIKEMQALQYVITGTVSTDRYFWVGLNRRGTESGDAWEWSDGRPVSTDIFSREFHEDDEYSRNCAAIKIQVRPHRFFLHPSYYVTEKSFHAIRFQCDAHLEWVCQIPRGKKETIPDWYNPNSHHESSIFVDSSEFWFVTNPKLTYEEAREYCFSNNSKLADPVTINAQKIIRKKLIEFTEPVGPLWWADAKIPSYYYHMGFTSMHSYPGFYDRCTTISPMYMVPVQKFNCDLRLPFVCERLKSTSLEKHSLPDTSSGQPCDVGSLAFGDKCYKVIKPLYLSFTKASEQCHTLRGTLLTIRNQVEQDFIVSLLPKLSKKFWIGLTLKGTDIQWVDNSTVSFHNFHPLVDAYYRPMRTSIFHPEMSHQCVYMVDDPHPAMTGTWDYTSCTDYQYLSICQHYADKPESPHIPEGNFTVGSHTYRILQKNMTWFEALQLCKEAHMDLASVTNTYQQAALTVAVSRAHSPMWIGLFSDDDGFHYRWTDHSNVVFSRWSPDLTIGQCVYQDTDGFWKATECEEVLTGAICQVPQDENTTKPEENLVKCPHKISGVNWIPFRNNCYTFQLDSSRWDSFKRGSVRNTCKKLDSDSDILTIRDEMENEFIKEQLLPFKDLVHFVWLGVFRDENVDRMKWYDGTNVQYSNWRDGRPAITKPFIAGLSLDGFWELFTDERFFSVFQQISIVACKIDDDPKEEFEKSWNDVGTYGNLSYYVIEQKLTWFDAVKACKSSGGHLASAHDTAHDAHLELISKKDGFPLWIGLSTQDMGISYEWSDGTSYDYKPQSFVHSNHEGNCVFVNTKGSWQQAHCLSKLDGAICYNFTLLKNSVCPQASVLPVSRICPQRGTSKWVEYDGYCYTFDMPRIVYNMEEAKSICDPFDDSSLLLTIKNKKENDFVSRCLSENPLVTGRIWLGIEMDHQAHPVNWVDGTSIMFSYWENNTYIADNETARCAVMQAGRGGMWSHVNCQDTYSRVVCKVPVRTRSINRSLVILSVIALILVITVLFVIYRRNRALFSSTVQYRRSFDEDSTSIITQME